MYENLTPDGAECVILIAFVHENSFKSIYLVLDTIIHAAEDP